MTNFRNLALAASLPLTIYACATALEIEGDLVFIDPNYVPPGGIGGEDAGTGGGNFGAGGNGSMGSGSSGDGSSGEGSSGDGGSGSGGDGSAGNSNGMGGDGGAGGSGAAGNGSGGTDNLGGTGGQPMGTGGSSDPDAGAGGDTGGGGTGGAAQSVFDPAACDFNDDSGCENLGCSACDNCQDRCTNIETCVTTECAITEADPLCAIRDVGTPNTCTPEVDSGGGLNGGATEPSSLMLEWVSCMCQTGRL